MGVLQADPDLAESLAGVVRLLRRAAGLLWAQSDPGGPRSAGQLLALGVDVLVDDVCDLVGDPATLEGPEPVGDDPAQLLRSAAELLVHLSMAGGPPALASLQARVTGLVWEVNTGAGA